MLREYIYGSGVCLCHCCAPVCAYVQVADQRISQPDVQWAPVEAHCRLFSLNSQGKKVFKGRYVTLTERPTELTSQFVSPDCQATSCPQQYKHANQTLPQNLSANVFQTLVFILLRCIFRALICVTCMKNQQNVLNSYIAIF